jgi:3-oxoadipate enol-lactonase
VTVARSGDVELYYESTGDGSPVLLVMGLGMNATGWWRTVPVLAERHRVLAFDNRGMGRSSVPAGGYAMADLADDAVAVLDAAGEDAAHVYGISLGGMIAQHLALRHPGRVRSLVLAATTPGGRRGTVADADTLAFFQRRGAMPPEEAVWASVPYNYAPRTRAHHADRIGEDIVQRLRFPFAPEPYREQLAAALGHDPGDGLASLALPTLVVHGERDRMIPVANAHALSHAIPGAELALYPEAGHLLFTDEPDVDRDVRDWLSARA